MADSPEKKEGGNAEDARLRLMLDEVAHRYDAMGEIPNWRRGGLVLVFCGVPLWGIVLPVALIFGNWTAVAVVALLPLAVAFAAAWRSK